MSSLADLKLDAEEVRKFISTSGRARVKEVLQRELISLQQEISLMVHDEASHQPHSEEKPNENKPSAGDIKKPKPLLYTKAITSYAWDQSDKFVKIYITLDGVDKLPREKITSKFTKNSADVVIHELDGKNHQFKMARLCHGIVSEESYVKVKTGSLLLMMKKEKLKENWEDVYPKVRSTKDEPTMAGPGGDDSSKDPQGAVMDMMRKMYEEGDDDMKRTIGKAWTESREKATGPPTGLGDI
jgi:calcyclin binding protein